MNGMDDNIDKKLSRVITRQRPFGPPDAAQFTDSTDMLRMLYDPANRIHRQAESTGAPYVIGRKGAGKTAFVMAPKLLPHSITIELPNADLYQGVFGVARTMSDNGIVVFAEHIVDSLERYTGVLPSETHHEAERISFEGLFRFIGGDGTMSSRSFDIRFAFPAELWSLLERVSANPIKDFDQRVIAHWSAKELISLIGTRLAIYFRLYYPELRVPQTPSNGTFKPLTTTRRDARSRQRYLGKSRTASVIPKTSWHTCCATPSSCPATSSLSSTASGRCNTISTRWRRFPSPPMPWSKG